MRFFSLTAASAIAALLLAPGAGALTAGMTAGTVPGIQKGLAETGLVEPVVRVCRHRFFTSRRECFVDRSRPPTVCHHIRATSRRDCY